MNHRKGLLEGSFFGRLLLVVPASLTANALQSFFRRLGRLVLASATFQILAAGPTVFERTGSTAESALTAAWAALRRPLQGLAGLWEGSLPARLPLDSLAPGLFLLLPFLPTVLAVPLVWLLFLDALLRGRISQVPFRLLLFLAALVIVEGGLVSVAPTDSHLNLVLWLSYGLAFLYWYNRPAEPADRERTLLLLLAGGIVASGVGLHQLLTGVRTPSGWLNPETNPGIRTRIFSVFGNPDLFGMYLAVLLPYDVALILRGRAWSKVAAWAVLPVLLAALLLTYSRGAWLGVLAGIAVLLLFLRPWAVPALGLLAVPILLSKTLSGRFRTIGQFGRSHSVYYRELIWRATWPIVRHFPLTGIGLGPQAFTLVYPLQQFPGIVAAHTQNIYLQLLVEIGIPGLVLLLLVLWQLAAGALRRWLENPGTLLGALSLALLAVLVSNLLQGTVDDIWYDPHVNLVFWSLAGLSLAREKQP